MKRKSKVLGILAVCALVFLAACAGGAPAAPTADPGMLFTQAVETAYAQLTQTAQAVPAAPTNTLEPQATQGPTNTPQPTNTLLGAPTLTPLTTLGALSTPIGGVATQESCDNLLILNEGTIAWGAIMNPGEAFDQIFEVQNLGPCTWSMSYRLVWAYGSAFSEAEPVTMYYDVIPSDTIQLWVSLVAPTEPGTYFAAFVMQNDRGANFGIPDKYLYVQIVVPGTETP